MSSPFVSAGVVSVLPESSGVVSVFDVSVPVLSAGVVSVVVSSVVVVSSAAGVTSTTASVFRPVLLSAASLFASAIPSSTDFYTPSKLAPSG